jgi:hypothetical protein
MLFQFNGQQIQRHEDCRSEINREITKNAAINYAGPPPLSKVPESAGEQA